jgi:hypothetical protein
VITRAGVQASRVLVYVNVFRLHTAVSNCARDKDVVELLAALVVVVCIAFDGRDASQNVGLLHDTIEGGEDGGGLRELVEVTSEDDGSR